MRLSTLALLIFSMWMSAQLSGQSSIGMVTPFSISSDQGSAFVGDLNVSTDSGFADALVITAVGVVVDVIEVESSINLNVYPNPTTESIQISTDLVIRNIDIYNSEGKLMHSSDDTSIDVSRYMDGLYTIAINGTHALTFIKQ